MMVTVQLFWRKIIRGCYYKKVHRTMYRTMRTAIVSHLLNSNDNNFLFNETWCSINIQPRDFNSKSFIKVANVCRTIVFISNTLKLVPAWPLLGSCCRIFKSPIYLDKIAYFLLVETTLRKWKFIGNFLGRHGRKCTWSLCSLDSKVDCISRMNK